MAGARSPSPERLDDILVDGEDSYADIEQKPSPRAPSEAAGRETSSMLQPASTSQPEADTARQASGSGGAAKPVRQRIPIVGAMEDFKSAPKRQSAPSSQAGNASAGSPRPQSQADRPPKPQSQPQQQSGATRYFLLKSVSIENIERSVEEGIWATQVWLESLKGNPDFSDVSAQFQYPFLCHLPLPLCILHASCTLPTHVFIVVACILHHQSSWALYQLLCRFILVLQQKVLGRVSREAWPNVYLPAGDSSSNRECQGMLVHAKLQNLPFLPLHLCSCPESATACRLWPLYAKGLLTCFMCAS